MKQFLFLFASREAFNEDINLFIANLGFYEQFEDWINIQNHDGILPELGDNREPVSIEVMTFLPIQIPQGIRYNYDYFIQVEAIRICVTIQLSQALRATTSISIHTLAI